MAGGEGGGGGGGGGEGGRKPGKGVTKAGRTTDPSPPSHTECLVIPAGTYSSSLQYRRRPLEGSRALLFIMSVKVLTASPLQSQCRPLEGSIALLLQLLPCSSTVHVL
ncbi:hypothetical protein EYF80_057862 [Liparis tanakae]|uniref:Uncharacterized protein n=1 Tax=Liparis tanakae TaxID=230148 RepID=A0A4Z2ETL5_9TELE|nr:hypothetical protein EYF80_057862 [Liparis tanakae]